MDETNLLKAYCQAKQQYVANYYNNDTNHPHQDSFNSQHIRIEKKANKPFTSNTTNDEDNTEFCGYFDQEKMDHTDSNEDIIPYNHNPDSNLSDSDLQRIKNVVSDAVNEQQQNKKSKNYLKIIKEKVSNIISPSVSPAPQDDIKEDDYSYDLLDDNPSNEHQEGTPIIIGNTIENNNGDI